MKSTILTKVNTVTPRNFGEQCEWMAQTERGNFDFLVEFVKHIHGKQKETEITIMCYSHVSVYTSKSHYEYKAYPKHIVRVDRNTTKKKFYKIS